MSYIGNRFNLSLIEGILEMIASGKQKYKENFAINCNRCSNVVSYYCPKKECEQIRLCHECYELLGHSHRMERLHIWAGYPTNQPDYILSTKKGQHNLIHASLCKSELIKYSKLHCSDRGNKILPKKVEYK